MNARDFHDEIVEPTLKEFDADFGNRRCAFLAVAVVDSLVAHIYAEATQNNIDPFDFLGGRYVRRSQNSNGKVVEKDIDITDFDETNGQGVVFTTAMSSDQRNDSYFRQRIADGCDAFRLIRDLAKANKHAELVKHKPLVSSSDQAISKPMGYGLGRYGKGRFGGVPQMMIRLNAPTTGKEEPEEVYFEHVLHEAYCVVTDLLGVLDRRRGREPREYAWHTANEQEL
ncbi:hypothetical protein [Mesorhizobium humile]|uniref:Uncharacterized protein n=1 Tax=Mesorhizobium humile TaxID=3072313 RepID=A0ABU4YMT5_9HYPH|nr:MULTISPECIES: hypothetical protein [unclassified Mesorhizobium]MDX8462368.1 hypothetical protein [Mesorhizobium sp. VK2D]MDX8487568.1 hypothetical protein [Mesorhizobium sp. VK2B]